MYKLQCCKIETDELNSMYKSQKKPIDIHDIFSVLFCFFRWRVKGISWNWNLENNQDLKMLWTRYFETVNNFFKFHESQQKVGFCVPDTFFPPTQFHDFPWLLGLQLRHHKVLRQFQLCEFQFQLPKRKEEEKKSIKGLKEFKACFCRSFMSRQDT